MSRTGDFGSFGRLTRRVCTLLIATVVVALVASPRTAAQGTYVFTVIVPEGSNLGFPPPVAINSAGQVAFVGTPPSAAYGVYRGDGTTLTLVYDPGVPNTQAPPTGAVAINASGTVAFGTYGPAFGSQIVLSDGGATHVNGPWVAGGEPSINDAGRFVYGISNGVDAGIAIDAAITPLAVPGDPMPGGTLAGAHFPLVNNSGQVAFFGSLTDGSAHFFRTSVTPGGPVVAMGSSNGGSLLFGMNDAGHIAYLGLPAVGPATALYVSDGATQTPVVVATPDFLLEPHMTPINDAGHVAFVAQAGSATPVRRVYVWHGSGLWEVIGQGDTIPGLGTVLDFSIGNDSLNDRDQVAFTVRYDDGGGTDKYAVVRADPVNVPPVAVDASLSAIEDTPAAGTLVGSDVHSDPLTFSIAANGTLGAATITDAATGAFSYVPNPDAHGTDTFTFTVSDGVFDSNIATVSVTVAPVNDPPVATGDSVLAVSGVSINGFLHATDVDGPPLTYSMVSNPSLGSAVITNATTGAFTYSPPAGSSGGGIIAPLASLVDTVTFKASDGALDSNVATVTFTLRVDDAPPSLLDLRVVTREGRAVAGRLAATNLPRGRPTFELVSAAERGTVSLQPATGAFVYRPRPGVHGVDRFTVRVRAGHATSNVAEVTVVIAPRADRRR